MINIQNLVNISDDKLKHEKTRDEGKRTDSINNRGD